MSRSRRSQVATKKSGTVTAFNTRRLHQGDIILTAMENIKSKIIRLGSGKDYSHAGVFVDDKSYIEAIGTGVRRVAILDKAVRDPSHARVLRLKRDISNRSEVIQAAVLAASSLMFREYWLPGALLSPLNLARSRQDRLFCSHLVAHCFKSSGLDLLPGRTPSNVTPGMFVDSPVLEDVTTNVLKPIKSVEAKFDTYWLNLDHENHSASDRVSDYLVELNLQTAKRIQRAFKNEGLTAPHDIMSAVIAVIQLPRGRSQTRLDDILADTLESVDYANFWDNHRPPDDYFTTDSFGFVWVLEFGTNESLKHWMRSRRNALEGVAAKLAHAGFLIDDYERASTATKLKCIRHLIDFQKGYIKFGELFMSQTKRQLSRLKRAISASKRAPK